jgi:hypothetical protein
LHVNRIKCSRIKYYQSSVSLIQKSYQKLSDTVDNKLLYIGYLFIIFFSDAFTDLWLLKNFDFEIIE